MLVVRFRGREFNSRPFCCQVTAFGKLFTHTCASIIKQDKLVPLKRRWYGWEGNRGSPVALAMHSKTSVVYPHYREGDEPILCSWDMGGTLHFFTVIVPRSAMALRDKCNTLGLLLSWKLRYMLHKMLVYVASLTVLLRNNVPIGRRAVDMLPYTTHWTQPDWLTALSDTGRSSPLCRERPSVLFPVTGEVQRAEARGSKGRQRDGVFGEREASSVSTRYGVRERCKLTPAL